MPNILLCNNECGGSDMRYKKLEFLLLNLFSVFILFEKKQMELGFVD